MPTTTYAQLQTRVGQIVIDLPATVTAQLPTLVNEAIKELQDNHNFKVMEKLSSVYVTTENEATLATKPTDFKEFRGPALLVGQQGDVSKVFPITGAPEAWGYFGTIEGGEAETDTLTGRPRVIWISEPTDDYGAATFELAPLPDGNSLYADGDYRIVVPYYRYLTDLSADADHNWFTDNCTEWIVYKAASMAFFDDHNEQGGTLWANLAAAKYAQVLKADKRLRVSNTDTLRVQPAAQLGPLLRGRPSLGFRWR